MRDNFPQRQSTEPLIPATAFASVIMIMAALTTGVIYIASGKSPMRAKVYFAGGPTAGAKSRERVVAGSTVRTGSSSGDPTRSVNYASGTAHTLLALDEVAREGLADVRSR